MVAPASRLLPELGRQLGMKLVAGSSTKDDVLAVVSPPRPTSVILDGIARAANATWEQRSTEWVLTRTKQQSKEDEEVDREHDQQMIRSGLARIRIDHPFEPQQADALADFVSDLVGGEMTPERQEAFALANERAPGARLVKRLCQQMDLAQLARVPAGQRRVYSTQPNKHQFKLDIKNLSSLLATYREEQQHYNDAILKKGLPSITIATGTGFHDMDAPQTEWSIVNVTIDRSLPQEISIFVQLLDAQRSLLRTIPMMVRTPSANTPPPHVPETNIELDPLSIRAAGAFANWLGHTKQQLEFFSDPEIRDPLEYIHRPALQAWSTAVGKPVFALLTDSSRFGRVGSPLKLQAYVGEVSRQFAVDDDGARIVLRPRLPFQTSQQRVDRSILERYADDCRKHGYATIRGLIEFTGTSRDPFAAPVEDFRALVDGVSDTRVGGGLFAKLIQLASPSMRDALMNGTTIELKTLTLAQRKWLEECLFRRDVSMLGPEVLTDGHEVPNDFTEAYPNGLPNGIQLVTRSLDEAFVNVKFNPETNPYTFWFSASELSTFIEEPKDHVYQYGPGRTLTVVLKLPPGLQFVGTFTEFRVPTEAPWVPFEKLPQGLQDDVLAKLKERSKPPPL